MSKQLCTHHPINRIVFAGDYLPKQEHQKTKGGCFGYI